MVIVFVQQGAICARRIGVIAAEEIGIAHPVIDVGGACRLRILPDKLAECACRLGIAFAAIESIGGIEGLIFATGRIPACSGNGTRTPSSRIFQRTQARIEIGVKIAQALFRVLQ